MNKQVPLLLLFLFCVEAKALTTQEPPDIKTAAKIQSTSAATKKDKSQRSTPVRKNRSTTENAIMPLVSRYQTIGDLRLPIVWGRQYARQLLGWWQEPPLTKQRPLHF